MEWRRCNERLTGPRSLQNIANVQANNDEQRSRVAVAFSTSAARLDIDNAIITRNNLATENNGNGGGVMTVGGIVTIDNTTIRKFNVMLLERAGGIGIENNNGQRSTLTNVTLGRWSDRLALANTAGINGGGLHATGAASVTTVNDSTVTSATSPPEEGGGLVEWKRIDDDQRTPQSLENIARASEQCMTTTKVAVESLTLAEHSTSMLGRTIIQANRC